MVVDVAPEVVVPALVEPLEALVVDVDPLDEIVDPLEALVVDVDPWVVVDVDPLAPSVDASLS